jgi:hypothetical protein
MKMSDDGGSILFEPDGSGGWKEFQKIGHEDSLTTSPLGFDKTQPQQQLDASIRYWETNVSYAYPDGTPLPRTGPNADDFNQNLANLFYDPRPPVFVTNRQTGVADFRYYLDLNRNSRFDTNGFLPVISPLGGFYDTNGNYPPLRGVPIATNFFVGDPEWIGVLERPDQPHSSSNRFTARFAWIAIPAGKTLDLNSVHNQTKMLNPRFDGFLRNMGVAPFEMNLAGFLADLNTNLWNRGSGLGVRQAARLSADRIVGNGQHAELDLPRMLDEKRFEPLEIDVSLEGIFG